MSLSLILGVAVVLILVSVWWGMVRLRRIRGDEERRSEAALAELRASQRTSDAEAADEAMTFLRDAEFGDGSTSSPRALEVAEFEDGVDIDALLADERERVAQRSRETLAQITLPMVDVPRLAEPAQPLPAPAASRMPSMPAAAASHSSAPVATPGSPVPPGPRRVVGSPRPAAPVAAPRAAAVATDGIAASERLTETPVRSFVGGGDLVRNAPDGLPLREVALAWFEARGYRSSAASPAVRPIERVLRHRQDATRGYAFVVEHQPVSDRRIEQLQTLALSVGLKRLLVVAEAGADGSAPRQRRGVRLMDRRALAAELDRLDLSIAAKIIAVARKRAAVLG
jgi:hypothetical protein